MSRTEHCDDCGREYPEPTSMTCTRGHTITKVYDHRCNQHRGRQGYCRDCYQLTSGGVVYWDPDSRLWRRGGGPGGGRRQYTCEWCGVVKGYTRGPAPAMCVKCKNAAKPKPVDYPKCEWCGRIYCRQLITRRGRKPQRYCCRYCSHRASGHTREQRQQAALKSSANPKPKRKKQTREARLALAYRQGYKCWHCKKLIDLSAKAPHPLSLDIDHVIPVSKRGTNDEPNLVASHRRCNIKRGANGPIQLGFDKPGVGT